MDSYLRFSIPTRFILYAPVLDEGKDYVLGQGDDAMKLIALGALFELIVIIANVGTAVLPFSIHKRVNEAGAVGYVAARIMECTFIAVGLLCMLAISTLRQDAPSGLDAALGQGLEAVYEWAFRLGPGLRRRRRQRPDLGLAHVQVRVGAEAPRDARTDRWPVDHHLRRPRYLRRHRRRWLVQAIMTIPEFFWELLLGIYLIVKGYRTSAVAELEIPVAATTV